MGIPETGGYDLNALAKAAEVNPRTIRYYTQQGLLPSPGQTGPGVRYQEGYLHRLLLIRKLQREHQPLVEIRKQLGSLSDAEVEAALRVPSPALDYVHSVLRASPGLVQASVAEPRFAPSINVRAGRGDRSSWERIALTDDVELHVRRPLSRHANRQVEALLKRAREIFEGDEHS